MRLFASIFIIFLIFLNNNLLSNAKRKFGTVARSPFTKVKNDLHGVIFQYFGESHSEKFLPICAPNAVCSIVYNRFWQLPMITRLCRCSSGIDCPWEVEKDNKTMFLNNRSSLKFCEPVVNDLKTCSDGEIALTIESYKENDIYLNKPPKAIGSCYCDEEHYWKHTKKVEQSVGANFTVRVINYFKCYPLDICGTNDFCGNVRADFHSIYFTCSCPINHLCIYKDNNVTHIDELFYQGVGYQAHCIDKETLL